jgi:hypothetical protein
MAGARGGQSWLATSTCLSDARMCDGKIDHVYCGKSTSRKSRNRAENHQNLENAAFLRIKSGFLIYFAYNIRANVEN